MHLAWKAKHNVPFYIDIGNIILYKDKTYVILEGYSDEKGDLRWIFIKELGQDVYFRLYSLKDVKPLPVKTEIERSKNQRPKEGKMIVRENETETFFEDLFSILTNLTSDHPFTTEKCTHHSYDEYFKTFFCKKSKLTNYAVRRDKTFCAICPYHSHRKNGTPPINNAQPQDPTHIVRAFRQDHFINLANCPNCKEKTRIKIHPLEINTFAFGCATCGTIAKPASSVDIAALNWNTLSPDTNTH